MNTDKDRSMEPLDEEDEAILAALRDIHAELDPVPAGLNEDVKFAITVQALHAEVAELQRLGMESALDAVALRSVEYTRAETLTFTGGPYSTMVTVVGTGTEQVRIDGWVTGGAVTVELRERSRTSSVDVDADGRFVFEHVGRGLIQFVLYPRDRDASVKPVITPSFDV